MSQLEHSSYICLAKVRQVNDNLAFTTEDTEDTEVFYLFLFILCALCVLCGEINSHLSA